MKILKTASGNKLKLSKKEWQGIGKKAGWMKSAKSVNHPAEVLYTASINGVDYDLEVSIVIDSIENDGIGSYEFWGAKEFDKGTDSIGDFSITNVTLDDPSRSFTSKEVIEVIAFLNEDEGFNEKVFETIPVEDVLDDDGEDPNEYDSYRDRQEDGRIREEKGLI